MPVKSERRGESLDTSGYSGNNWDHDRMTHDRIPIRPPAIVGYWKSGAGAETAGGGRKAHSTRKGE